MLDMQEINERAKKIKVMIFDVDGVMTDGSLGLDDNGEEFKTFHSHDGLGLKMLKKTGIKIALMTGRTSNVVIKRAENIGAKHIYQGAEDKLLAFNALLSDMQVTAEECLMMGDDVVDLPPIRRCGLGIAVPHAMPLVKEYAHYVTTLQAGRGAVREICELVMKAQGTFDEQMAFYLK